MKLYKITWIIVQNLLDFKIAITYRNLDRDRFIRKYKKSIFNIINFKIFLAKVTVKIQSNIGYLL